MLKRGVAPRAVGTVQNHCHGSGPADTRRIAVYPYFARRHGKVTHLLQAVGHLDDGFIFRHRSDDDFAAGHRVTVFITLHYFKAAAIIVERNVERIHAGITVRGGLRHTVNLAECQR